MNNFSVIKNNLIILIRGNPLAVFALIVWLIQLMTFLIGPFLLMLNYSFHARDFAGGVLDSYSIQGWVDLFSLNVVKIWSRSILISTINTILCVIIGIPMAFFLHNLRYKYRKIAIILLLLPLGINSLLVAYSWQIILGNNGLLNTFLVNNKIIKESITILYTSTGISIGLLGFYLTYFVLAFTASLDQIDPGLIYASKTCGANDFQTLIHVILPLTKPGLIAGILLVFLPSLAEYIIPDLLGGNKVFYLGTYSKYLFYEGRNWQLGAALLTIMSIFLTLLIIPFINHIKGVFAGKSYD